MAEPGRKGPFELPGRWVHASQTPTWSDLAETAVAFVAWRRDRWPSLERLHRVARLVDGIEGAAIALGLHPFDADRWPPARVRDALLARGTPTPTGLVPPDAEPRSLLPGQALVVSGSNVCTFDPDTELDRLRSAIADAASSRKTPWRSRGAAPGPWPLAYPADLDVSGARMAIADTGHNRVLVAGTGGEVTHAIGEGVPDLRDGSLEEARFEAPRGIAWHEGGILVSDTGNDRIGRIDLREGRVSTIAHVPEGSLPAGLTVPDESPPIVALPGKGRIARLDLDGGRLDPEVAQPDGIRHPVDVVAQEGDLWVADLAGPAVHRISGGETPAACWSGAPLSEPRGLLATRRSRFVADPIEQTVFELREGGQKPVHPLLEEGIGMEAPTAVSRETSRLIVVDEGTQQVWRLEPEDPSDAERVRLTEPLLAVSEHVRLDPVELAPGGRLVVTLTYLSEEGLASEEHLESPELGGPLEDVRLTDGPRWENGRVTCRVEGGVAASGSLRIRWRPDPGPDGSEVAWDLPVIARPGADEDLRLTLSASGR